MLRHPNIVQIMAISIERNELYIISELVDGPNLEELIFFEGEDQSQMKITPDLRKSIGKKLCTSCCLSACLSATGYTQRY
jgi:E3 ubiquitin-protein ligase mind-bomb